MGFQVSKERRFFEVLHEWTDSHSGSVYCLDVLGKLGRGETCLLATGSNDKCIRIFRADTGEVSGSIKGGYQLLMSLLSSVVFSLSLYIYRTHRDYQEPKILYMGKYSKSKS